jgi:hypothetical protein
VSNNRLIRDDDSETVVPTPKPTTTSAELELTRPAKPRTFGRGPYKNRRQVTAHIDPQLFKWLKTMHVQTGKTMVEMMEEALAEYVQRYAVQKKMG